MNLDCPLAAQPLIRPLPARLAREERRLPKIPPAHKARRVRKGLHKARKAPSACRDPKEIQEPMPAALLPMAGFTMPGHSWYFHSGGHSNSRSA